MELLTGRIGRLLILLRRLHRDCLTLAAFRVARHRRALLCSSLVRGKGMGGIIQPL